MNNLNLLAEVLYRPLFTSYCLLQRTRSLQCRCNLSITSFKHGGSPLSCDVLLLLMFKLVLVLSQVLSAYIWPSAVKSKEGVADKHVPSIPRALPELLTQSCLVPALSSYLRNDSGWLCSPQRILLETKRFLHKCVT